MDILQIVLRIAHIFGGVMWVGGSALFFFFLEPAAKATAPESRKYMGHLMSRGRFITFMAVASLTTIIAGALLYWRASGFRIEWITSGPGLGFTIGATASIIVFLFGNLVIGPTAERLATLVQRIQDAGVAPSAEQTAELHRLEARMTRLGRIDILLLGLALLTMATARYWTFM